MSKNEENNNNGIFFPNDVDSTSEKAGGVSDKEKNGVFFAIWGLLNFFAVFTLPSFMQNLGVGVIGSVLIIIALNLLLFGVIFRFVVFDENKKAKEYNAHTSDSFARFFKLNKNVVETLEIRGYGEIEVFQYNNGHYLVALRFRYGSADNEKARNTREAYERMYNILSKNRLEFKMLSSNENFRESKEYRRYKQRMNNSPYKDIAMRIFEEIMYYTDNYSNVTANTLLIRTTSKGQMLDLPRVLAEIVRLVDRTNTSIRGTEFLNFSEFLEFIKEYYGLEAIQLAKLKDVEQNPAELNKMLKEVGLFEIRTVDNKIKTSKTVKEAIAKKMFTGTEEVRHYDKVNDSSR
ncbi:hypothetical protein UT300012_24070 [Paraclostridium bifermentans]